MAKSKQRKKKGQQSTPKKSSNRPIPKSTPRQKFLVGIMIFAMVMFVLGGLFKSFNGSKNNTVEAPVFRMDGELSFMRGEELISTIEIERVETQRAINQGLMNRKSMQENRGMLFIMPKSEPQSFWMRNTFLPLDIIFVNQDEKIVTVHKHTTPQSEKALESKIAAKYVVEVNAGYCDKFGIRTGDYIKF